MREVAFFALPSDGSKPLVPAELGRWSLYSPFLTFRVEVLGADGGSSVCLRRLVSRNGGLSDAVADAPYGRTLATAVDVSSAREKGMESDSPILCRRSFKGPKSTSSVLVISILFDFSFFQLRMVTVQRVSFLFGDEVAFHFVFSLLLTQLMAFCLTWVSFAFFLDSLLFSP